MIDNIYMDFRCLLKLIQRLLCIRIGRVVLTYFFFILYLIQIIFFNTLLVFIVILYYNINV